MPTEGLGQNNIHASSGLFSSRRLRSDWTYSIVLRTLAAAAVSFLWFAPFLSTFLEEQTRVATYWQRHDALSLLGLPIFVALIFVCASELVRRVKIDFLTRCFNHLFIIALGGGLLTVAIFQLNKLPGLSISPIGTQAQTAWMLLAASAGYSFARGDSQLVRKAYRVSLILSPLPLILIIQIMAQRTYPLRHDSLTLAVPQALSGEVRTWPALADKTQAPPPPVYLFIFDEWSYRRTFCNDELDPVFTNLDELSRQSLVFTDAHSPGRKTELSLPGILFQTDLPVATPYPKVGFKRDGQFVSSGEFDSIFSCVAERDYHSVLLGFGFPSHLWLDEQVECYRMYNFSARGRNLFEDMAMHFMCATMEMNGPWFTAFRKTFGAYVYYPYYHELFCQLERDVSQILTQWPKNTFAVMHYLLPHKPFIFREDGSARGPDRVMYQNSPENYRAHLICLDRTIGRFVDLMKKAGTFDDALIIMTSDHSWRTDPLRWHDPALVSNTHVPLFVKMPGQTRHAKISHHYKLSGLRPLIEYALRQNDGDLEGARRLVRDCAGDRQYLVQVGE
ncbi:MAG: sulfatase-like hydrolase/transferase [Phycisphaerales bacterium]|nr:MAG: sulfatase-like hydrolase/transferase [Phycisphaerales bacterium]